MRFTSRELALAADLTPRNVALLHETGLAPAPAEAGGGRGGHRLYDSPALAHAALIGALHLAGFELLVSARLAAAFADDFGASHGKIHSNLAGLLRNSFQQQRHATEADKELALEDDFWAYLRILETGMGDRVGVAIAGDLIIDIADHQYVLTESFGPGRPKVFSPVLKEGLPASPDYRIVGRGSTVEVVPITDEVDTMDFFADPLSAARYKVLQQDYLAARENAVTRVRVNVSLAIRNAFARVRNDRVRIAA